MTSKIIRSDGVTELTGIKSVVYTESVNAGENLKPGCVGSAYIDVEVYGAQSSSPTAGEELSYYQVDDNNNATLIGLFYAEPSVPTKNTYKFVAYDAVSKLDKPYSEHLNSIQTSFPMTVYDLVDDACTFAGVTLGSASWPLSTQTVQAFYADNLTCRNILQYAAEIAGKFVRGNTSGAVIFDWYTTSSYGIKPGVDTNAVAYKQDGLTYSKYASVAVDAVAVKPVGTEGAAYIYPSSIGTVTATDPNGDGNVILTNLSATDDGSGNIYLNVNAEDDNEDGNVEITNAASAANTLIISGNLLLMNASDATYNAVAQNLYNVMSALPSFRYAEVNLFTGENPFRAGQFISMTDAQGVSFTAPVFEMKVSAAAAVLRSSGKQTYEEQTTGESKALANLSANIVQLEKLKVGWAEIDTAIVNSLTANGINANWINAGRLLARYIRLYGSMNVYSSQMSQSIGGAFGYCTTKDDSFASVNGMAMMHNGGDAVIFVNPDYFLLGIHDPNAPWLDGGDLSFNSANISSGIRLISDNTDTSLQEAPIGTTELSIYAGKVVISGYDDGVIIDGRNVLSEVGTLSSLNTTAKSSLVAAVNELESSKLDTANLLWTNSNQATFAATTLTSSDLADDLSNYNCFIITCHQRNNGYTSPYSYVTRVCNMKDAAVGDTVNCNITDITLGSSYEIIVRQRIFRINRNSNTIEITTGYYGENGTSGNSSATTMVPISIYGLNI